MSDCKDGTCGAYDCSICSYVDIEEDTSTDDRDDLALLEDKGNDTTGGSAE